MTEVPLRGGDVNVVVRVGDTVRRPPEPAGVRALLTWYERAGFDSAPRFLGFDDAGARGAAERLRILCDAYDLTTAQRAALLDELVAQREGRLRRADWRVTGRDAVVANLRWLAERRRELARALT